MTICQDPAEQPVDKVLSRTQEHLFDEPMSSTDPRHTTWAGYVAGCRQDCCRTAAWRYQKARVWDAANGRKRLIDATGTRRRIEALVALGWSQQQIGEMCGVSGAAVRHWRHAEQVWRSTADKLAATYEAMCMTLPPETTWVERNIASRMRSLAKRSGWAPPLAWDDIDTDAEPATTRSERRNKVAEFDELVGGGESPEMAAQRLGVQLGTINTQRRRKVA